MAWLSRNTFSPTDRLHADDLNNLANDQRTWGGDVNGGGHVLSNVVLVGVSQQAVNDVLSVFGRVGSVVAQAGDYSVAQVTGAVPNTRQVIAGPGLAGGGPLTGDVTLGALVTSVFGRTGAVTLTPTDITNASGVLTSRMIATGAGLTGGGNLSADRIIAMVPDSIEQRIQVLAGGALLGTRHALNFIQGANINLAITDNQLSNRVDIVVSASGGGSPTIDPTTTLGDLIVRSATPALARLGIGNDGQVLTADSTQPLAIKWATPMINSITSVFGRTGVIVAAAGDYSAAQVLNAVDSTQAYANPAWLTALAWTKVTGAPAYMTDPLTTKGDLIVHAAVTTRLPVAADGMFLMTDSTQAPGVRWATVATYSQTPWTGDHDAAGFSLRNTRGIGIGGAAGSNNPLDVRLTSADAAMEVSSVLFADPTSRLQFGCSATYATTGAPWAQGYLPAGAVCPIILQPAGSTVGIGQTNPAFALDVVGDVNVSGNFRVGGVIFAVSQSPWTTDQDAVGHKLDNVYSIGMGGPAGGQVFRIQTPAPTIQMESPGPDETLAIQFNAGGVHRWETGVGLPIPGYFYIRDVNGTVRIQIDATGRVGMGHLPNYPLDVAGDINATGVFRVNGVEVGTVSSVFGRTGEVSAATGDYAADQVTNAVDQTVAYANPPWIASLAWSKIVGAPAIGVSSVYGRGGAVLASTGDYTVAQVTGAVATTRMLNTGTGLTGGGNLSQDRTFAVVPDSVNQQVQVLLSGAIVGTRHAINFVPGANVSLSIADDTTLNRINLTVSSTGGSGGMVDPTTTVGDLILRGPSAVSRLGVGANGQVLMADSAQLLGVRWATPTGGAGGAQTPWTQAIDAAGFDLNTVGNIGVNVASNAIAARVYIHIGATEEGVSAIASVAENFASLSAHNDIGDYVRVRSYGTNYTIDPGTASLEASGILKLMANSVEVLRLTTGHVLIGTIVDDMAHMLQVNGTVKSAAGGFVFPDGTTQATAAGPTTNLVTSVFTRTGDIVAQAGDYSAAQVTNAVSTTGAYANPAWITSLAWSKITGAPAAPVASVFSRTGVVVANAGDYTAAQVTNAVSTAGAYADPAWITSLAWSKITGAPVFSQTPWVTDVDAALHTLKNVSGIGIGGSAFGGIGIVCNTAAISDLLNQTNTSATAYAGFQFLNDLGHGWAFRQYGSAYTGTPDRTSFEFTGSDIVFKLDTSEVLRIRQTNRYVGIGYATPTSALHVVSGAGGPGALSYHGSDSLASIDSAGNSELAIGFYGGGSTFPMWLQARGTGNVARPLILQPAGSIVGIGNPGNPPFSGSGFTHFIVGSQTATDYGFITVCGNAPLAATTDVGAIAFANYAVSGAEKRIAQIRCATDNGVIGEGRIDFLTWHSGAANWRMTLLANGNVGIGTTGPTVALDVAGCIRTTYFVQPPIGSGPGMEIGYANDCGVIFCFDRTASVYKPYSINASAVGINTVTPHAALDVNGCIRSIGFVSPAGSAGPGLELGYLAGTGATISGYDRTAGTFLPLVISASKVGINTGTPTQVLTVVGQGFFTPSNAVWDPGDASGPGIRISYYGPGDFGYIDACNTGVVGKKLCLNVTQGPVGIGTTTPNFRLSLGADVLANKLAIYDANSTFFGFGFLPGYLTHTAGTSGGQIFYVNNTAEAMRITSTGWVGFGAASPSNPLVISNNGTSGLEINPHSGLIGTPCTYIVAFDRTVGAYRDIVFDQGGALSIIRANGRWGILTTDPQYTLHVAYDSAAKPSTSTWVIYSDERLKENRTPLQGGVDIINQLTLEAAEYNGADGTPKGKRVVSVSAQQAKLVMPHSVSSHKGKLYESGDKEVDILDWNAHELFMQAVLAIQQLDARLKALENAQAPKESIQ